MAHAVHTGHLVVVGNGPVFGPRLVTGVDSGRLRRRPGVPEATSFGGQGDPADHGCQQHHAGRLKDQHRVVQELLAQLGGRLSGL
jgi:hypothetical protein